MADYEQQDVSELAGLVVQDLEAGHSKRRVTAQLISSGIEPKEARTFVEEVDSIRRAQHRRGGNITTMFGLALLAVGVGVTAFTYLTAQPGETYVIAIGPAVVGLILVLRGSERISRNPETEE